MEQRQNVALAAKLQEMADLLDAQGADRFRVSAFRHAAGTLEKLARPVSEIIADKGTTGLIQLPAVGRGIAAALAEMVETGRWRALDRLNGAMEPEQLFQSVPGIGPDLAHRIHEELNIDSLEALEAAAHDGRLKHVAGIGPRRASVIRAVLKQRLDERHNRRTEHGARPSVAQILDVDQEYRQKAAANRLRKIAPKRFNPEQRAWLPVLHTIREDWSFTALYSNTQRAHDLGRTRDWVVLYAHRRDEPEQQCTVVTEHRGALAERRVVRGRESECLTHYATDT
ncbi:MAG: helix-hairpin-helix domain-containing protein [Hyphomicrobiaceae bacterium]